MGFSDGEITNQASRDRVGRDKENGESGHGNDNNNEQKDRNNAKLKLENLIKLRGKINMFQNQRNKIRNHDISKIQKPRNIIQALQLPKLLNLNPRSAMNKLESITRFIEEENIDVAFISETHERENKRLEDHMKLDTHTIISNIYQRQTKEKGGRPALIVNRKKFHVDNLTNTSINIPWGVEITWAMITPKNVSKDSIIKKIILGAIYVKPNSRKKSDTIDHIADVYNSMRVKHGKVLY